MTSKKIEDLFATQSSPEPSLQAKQAAKNLALQAFREEQESLTPENKLKKRQGFWRWLRPTSDINPPRDTEMKMNKPMWLGAMATSCVLVIGVLMTRHIPEDPAPSITPEPQATTTSPALAQNTEQKSENFQAKKAKELAALVNADAQVGRAEPSESRTTQEVRKNNPVDALSDLPSTIQESVSALVESEAVAAAKAAPPSSPAKKRQHSPPSSMAAHELKDLSSHPPAPDRDRFTAFEENAVTQVVNIPVSTFSIDVDTASYSFVRRQLNSGRLPPIDAVRIEELINYFDYNYPTPRAKTMPFKPSVTLLESPWNKGNKLIHIGIKGYDIPKNKQPDSNLVFKAQDKQTILAALNRLQAGGGTAGAQGITLAYQLAEANFKKDAVNRVILATDGDFNLGVTQDERLEDFVARKRKKGIYLSVLGFGQGNYQDALMQTLAQNGNGAAAYIDTLSEAQKVLVNEATSALFPIATDVKIQVEFNPAAVSEYRLIGYETRALNQEDFNNDKVDAGDIGAGHKVTAIYEITPAGSKSALVPDLRYAANKTKPNPSLNELGFLKIRYKLPGQNKSKLITQAISPSLQLSDQNPTIQQEVKFSTAVAAFGQQLKNSKYVGTYDYDQIIALAQANKGTDDYGYRTEFVQLVRKAKIAKAL